MTAKYEAVLFDLDGTLLDTALDLGKATNYVLGQHGVGPISDDTARAFASDGMRALLKSGIPESEHDRYDFEAMRKEFLPYYYDHIADRTVYFPETDRLINALKREHIPYAVVTSKPDHLARKVLSKFAELADIEVIVGCDTLPVSKPDPEPLFYACRQLKVNPAKCLYVGDHIRDIEAGHNAGMDTVLALWGYIRDKSSVGHFGAEYVAGDNRELAEIIGVTF
jgi:phosphoglycolate phosphatase